VSLPEALPRGEPGMRVDCLDRAALKKGVPPPGPIFLAMEFDRYRSWVRDRGSIPTEAHLELMRARGAQYLVRTPKGRFRGEHVF
jgi:hypothetical protein